MLRRGRLDEASDNDGTEANRPSQNSDTKPSTSRPQDSKKLSRLDILALPRKRTGSFTTPSDTESSADKTGFSNCSLGSGFSVRKASVPELKTSAQKGSGLTGKQPITRGRSSSAKYLSSTTSSRRHQKGSDYTSTSEEEYESNLSTPKHKRSHHSDSGPLHTSRTQNLGPMRALPRTGDSEEEGCEHDSFQNWTTHSAEIARLLFNNKTDVWKEIEAKINAAADSLPLESPNKEITSILRELKGIQKRLEVMNAIIDPSRNSDLTKSLVAGGHSAPCERNIRPSPRTWRSASSQHGGGPSPSCQQLGVQVRRVNFGHLTRGVLHSKFWVVDGRHIYIGSANMDWRALTQGSPPQFCPDSRTKDLDAILSAVSQAEQFIHVAVMEYYPASKFLYHHRYWPVIENALKQAAYEKNVAVRLLVSCGRESDPSVLPFLKSLNALDSPSNNISIEVRLHIVPVANQTDIPYARINHNKYMVTDKLAYIGTSNWSADYFNTTAGVGLVVSQDALYSSSLEDTLVGQLSAVFDRDWGSEFAVPLEKLHHNPDCAFLLS
ncbi:hypothetical protein P4O66_001691 [Electrophorus voltai]|uniref:PLD phosphodiesterase domain-containing protein n=1 Tax=Electrophorus voltai TaxID=2609070 RepID=A0AAD8Z521_9TELE|nr:hypothetical protein P4O66_001691 [Electrophorus voltai]